MTPNEAQSERALTEVRQAYDLGEFSQVMDSAQDLLTQAEQQNDSRLYAETLFILGSTQIMCRRFPEGEKNLGVSAEQFNRLNLQLECYRCMARLAKSWMMNQDFERSRNQLESIREQYKTGSNDLLDGELLVLEGLLASQGEHDYETAISCYSQACELFARSGHQTMVNTHKKTLAAFHSAIGEFDVAQRLLSESLVQLTRAGADRHVLEARINLALVEARRFHFNQAETLLEACLEHAVNRFDPAAQYRILYNCSIVDLALEKYTAARKRILRLLNIEEFNLSATQLGAVQTMLAAAELVLEGPEVCESILGTVAQNLPAYTRDLDWTYAMLRGLCQLCHGDVARARLQLDSAMSKPTGPDVAVYHRIIHSCTGRLIRGCNGKYASLDPGAITIADKLMGRLHQLSPGIFEAISAGR